MKKTNLFLSAGVLVLFLAGLFSWGQSNKINTPSDTGGNNTDLSAFSVPAGFHLSIFAKDAPGARVIEMDPKGRILVSETSEGKVVALSDTDNDGTADQNKILAEGLNNPHGLAMRCDEADQNTCFLYMAESDMLSRFPYDATGPSLGAQEDLMPISYSKSDRHFTRSLLFLPPPNENTLLVSAGSSCDACNEKDADHAVILSYDILTKKKDTYAKGLRNATFMTLDPVNGKVFATEMGRDNLGDDIPPDEINIISPPAAPAQNSIPNFGWPICYGKNIHDTDYDKKIYIRNPCMEPFEQPSFIDLQAHSAPLGLAFIPEEGWPEDYWYSLLVAYHGSWNRSTPTGYKIVRLKMNAKGEYLGAEDFITGWLPSADGSRIKASDAIGRPADIKVLSGGTVYITDDAAGMVYKLSQTKVI